MNKNNFFLKNSLTKKDHVKYKKFPFHMKYNFYVVVDDLTWMFQTNKQFGRMSQSSQHKFVELN